MAPDPATEHAPDHAPDHAHEQVPDAPDVPDVAAGAAPPTHPADHLDEAAALVAELTLEEKTRLCQGRDHWHTNAVDRLDIPSVMVADGPHGMRVQPEGGDHLGLTDSLPATCFPTASALAATWDVGLVAEVGAAIAREARAQGVDVVLGPGANIKRSPLCGRNFEYLSEDPFLTGSMAAAHISGVQGVGAGTSLKHFVANNQEFRRLTIDAVIDDRTLRELYLTGFEIAVRNARPWTVMSSYNRVNGTYAGEHAWLLGDVLRDQWGHQGIVVTDWGAMNDRVAAIAAGCELEMPGPVKGAPEFLAEAVASGELDEDLLDRAATRLVALALAARANRDADASFDVDAHHALARRAAADAVVLLRNEEDALPIRPDDQVALLGTMAVDPRYQGTGSSQIKPTRLDSLRDELTALVGADRLRWTAGQTGDEVDEDQLAQAVAAVADADVAIVHVGLPNMHENEGDDRTDLRLPPSHDALVAAVAAAHDRVVVVLSNGAPVEMPWVDDVEAVVEGYLGGQAGGGGLADVLTGAVAPAGRLGETFPVALSDVAATPNFPGGPRTVEYREGLWVGYRHTETVGLDVLFPFGHGLGYEPVAIGEVRLDVDRIDVAALRAGETVTVTVPVTNEGDAPTRHVVQVYVRDVESTVHRPDRELKGFAKVAIDPGETLEVELALNARSFAFWDTVGQEWFVEGGTFEVLVGNSSRDIRATMPLEVDGPAATPRDLPSAVTRPAHHLWVDRGSFETLLGRPVPPNDDFAPPHTCNTPIGAANETVAGKALGVAVRRAAKRLLGADAAAEPLIRAMAEENPVRTLLMYGLTLDQVDAVVAVLNGEWSAGVRQVFTEVKAKLGA
jgi:beta-glucosidase